LSSDDCLELLEGTSCILENETEEGFKYSRLALPGKNKTKTKLTVCNYVLCYFTREVVRNLFMEIKRIMYNDNFCKPESIILECSLPLKGMEKLASEVFEIPAKKAVVKWDGEVRTDLSSSAVGALQSLIAREEGIKEIKKKNKTEKFTLLKFFYGA